MQFLKEKITQYSSNLISLTLQSQTDDTPLALGQRNHSQRDNEGRNNLLVDESVAFYECEGEQRVLPSGEIRDQHYDQSDFKKSNNCTINKNGNEINNSSGEQSFYDCNDTLTPGQFEQVSHRQHSRGFDVTKKKLSHQVTPEFSRRVGGDQDINHPIQKRFSSNFSSQQNQNLLTQQAHENLQGFGSEVTFQYTEERFMANANQQVRPFQVQYDTNHSSQSKSYQSYQERKQRQSREIHQILVGQLPSEAISNLSYDKAGQQLRANQRVNFDQEPALSGKTKSYLPHKQEGTNDVALQNRTPNKEPGNASNPYFFQNEQDFNQKQRNQEIYRHAKQQQERSEAQHSQMENAMTYRDENRMSSNNVEEESIEFLEYATNFEESPSKLKNKSHSVKQQSNDQSSSSNMRRIIEQYEKNLKLLNKKQNSYLSSMKIEGDDKSQAQSVIIPKNFLTSNQGSADRLDLSNTSSTPSQIYKQANRLSGNPSGSSLQEKQGLTSPILNNKNSVGVYGQNLQGHELQYMLNQRSDSHQLGSLEYIDSKDHNYQVLQHHSESKQQSPTKLSQSRNTLSSHSVHINNSVINTHYHHYPSPFNQHPNGAQSQSNLLLGTQEDASPGTGILRIQQKNQLNHTEVDDISSFSSNGFVREQSRSAYSKTKVKESRNAQAAQHLQQIAVMGFEGQLPVRKLSKASQSAQKQFELQDREQQDFFVISKGGAAAGGSGPNGSSLNSMSMMAQNSSSFQQINLQSMNNSAISNFKQGYDNFKRKPSSQENNQDPISVSKLSSSNQSGISGGGIISQKQNALQNFEKNLNQKYPGYFQDYSTGQDLLISEELPQSRSGGKALDPSLSIFRTQSFLSQKNNSHGGTKQQDNIKKISLFTDSGDHIQPSSLHLLPPKGSLESENNLRQQALKSAQQSSSSLVFGGIGGGSNNSGSNSNTPQQQLRSLQSQAMTKTKLMNKTYTELNNLTSVQEIKCGNNAIWCIKFRGDGLYLATGGMDGILRIWKVCESPSEMINRSTIMPSPYREFHNAHSSDILDISWSSKNPNLVLTASADYNVLIFDINVEKQLRVLQHPSYVTSAHFKINSENYFASGCLDKIVRVWCIKTKKVIDWVQTACEITALKYSNCGERLYVGLVNGDVLIFDSTQEKLTPIRTVVCKNKRGKFSKGRKVTSIDFLSLNIAMVTTNDSRIRFIDARTGKQIYKIKGHKNESFPIRASISDDLAHVICGSEDGDLYLWSQIQSTVVQMSKKTLLGKLLLLNSDKSNSCEYFTPFSKSQSVTAAVFAPQPVIFAQMRRHFKVMGDKIVNMIIVTANMQGVIKIFHNETSSQSPNSSPKHEKSSKYKRHSVNI